MLVAAGAAVPLEHESEAGVLFRTVRLIGGVIAVTSIEDISWNGRTYFVKYELDFCPASSETYSAK